MPGGTPTVCSSSWRSPSPRPGFPELHRTSAVPLLFERSKDGGQSGTDTSPTGVNAGFHQINIARLEDLVTAQKNTPTRNMRRAILCVLVPGLGLVGCNDPVSPDDSVVVDISETASGASVGSIRVEQTADGARFTPNLTGLTPGEHGFHVHVNPGCGMAGQDAGGHYDPQGTGSHEGPNGNGHLGDLPTLSVNSSGAATTPVVAPRVRVSDLDGRSLMIHAGGDNYSDTPAPLGGGGARVACGVVPAMGT